MYIVSIEAWAQVAILLACGLCVVIVNCWDKFCTLGRAPCTKETLLDFHEWCRVTRHPRVFHGLTSCQRTPGFWGVTFDLVLRYGVCWHFLLMMRNYVKVEIVVFCDLIFFFWVYVRPEGSWYDFCEKKKLRKKIGICCGNRGTAPLGYFSYINTLRFISYKLHFVIIFQFDSETFSSARDFFP